MRLGRCGPSSAELDEGAAIDRGMARAARLVGEARRDDREGRGDAVEAEESAPAWLASSRYLARYSGAACVPGSGANTRGVHVSERSTTVRPLAAASSAHTRPSGSPAENTGTVSQPARDGAKGTFTGAGAVTGATDATAVALGPAALEAAAALSRGPD